MLKRKKVNSLCLSKKCGQSLHLVLLFPWDKAALQRYWGEDSVWWNRRRWLSSTLLLCMDMQRRILEEPWTSRVSGRARRIQLQVSQGIRELLFSLLKCIFLSPGCQAWLSSGGGSMTCRTSVMCGSFPPIVSLCRQTVLLALWGCFVQDMLSYTSAMSNAAAILLFFCMPWFAQLINVLMFTLCPSASLLRVLMSISLKIV